MYTGRPKYDVNKRRERRKFRKWTPAQHAVFLKYASQLKIELPADDDVQKSFDYMYEVMASLLDRFYPEREITTSSKDPRFVTPTIKAMLRRKNRLMRAVRTEEADAVSRRVRDAITRQNKAWLRRINRRQDAHDAWEKEREVTGGAKRTNDAVEGITAQALNGYYATISHDPEYKVSSKKQTASNQSICITEEEVFHILDRLKPTATGLDGIPAWYPRLGAAVFAAPIADLFNRSMSAGVVPKQWKKAIITPVPKVVKPAKPSAYRPISITAVLSRSFERHVVPMHIYPALQDPPEGLDFNDQFGF